MYIEWEKPRRWAVRLYKPTVKQVYGHHITVGIIALSIDRAIEAAQTLHPEMRIESVNDSGAVDIVVDVPSKCA